MKQAIGKIIQAIAEVKAQRGMTNTKGKDHGSPDQTRGILLESIFIQVEGNLKTALFQLEIIDRELY